MADNEGTAAAGVLAFIGIAFILMSSLFFVLMGDPRNVLVDRDLNGRAETVQGIVLGIEDTNTEVNEETVEVIGFNYTVDGNYYEGDSYATDYSVLNSLKVGGPVTVEYLPDAPHIGRVKGASFSQVPWWVYLILTPFMIVGVAMVCGSAAMIGQRIRGSQETTESTFMDASGQTVKEPWHEG